jgi:Domain of unknown function (DUF892)
VNISDLVRVVQANDQTNEAKAGFLFQRHPNSGRLFVHTLRDIYYAEQKILQALPEMIENSANPRLKSGLEQDLAQTQQQIHRLEKVFEMHGSQTKAAECPAIDGIRHPFETFRPLLAGRVVSLEIVFFSDGPVFRVAQFDHAGCGYDCGSPSRPHTGAARAL